MISALLSFLILIIVICIVAALLMWAFRTFGPPETHAPAKLVIGGGALIAILLALGKLVNSGVLAF